MKFKIIAAVSTLCFVTAIFTACSISFGNNNNNETNKTTDPSSYSENKDNTPENSTQATLPTSTTETSSESVFEPVNDKEEEDSMETLLTLIKDFPLGTAGSTAKNVEISLRILNFMDKEKETSTLVDEAEKFVSALGSQDRETFYENLDEIDYMVRQIAQNPDDTIKNYINDSGEPYNSNGYDLEVYKTVMKAVEACK